MSAGEGAEEGFTKQADTRAVLIVHYESSLKAI